MNTHRCFHVVIIIFALVSGNTSLAFSQSPQNTPSPSQIQKIKDQVKKLGNGEDVTVTLISGMEYYGAISKIEEDSFEIAEVDLKQMVNILYTDVAKVNSSTAGHQKQSKSRFGIIFIVVSMAALVGIVIWGVSKQKKRDFPTPLPRFP